MHTAVAEVLIDVEAELRQLALWDSEPPGDAALASEQPFAIDTLTFPQWLQFVFLPTMYHLIETREALPARCGITPMAEEYFRGREARVTALIEALEQVDLLLTGSKPDYGVSSDQVN